MSSCVVIRDYHVFYRNIYLGETFSSYICVHNDSTQPARDVTLKV